MFAADIDSLAISESSIGILITVKVLQYDNRLEAFAEGNGRFVRSCGMMTNTYWNGEGAIKTFTHPVNMDWLQKHLNPDARILDYGCGYGRVATMLSKQGYAQYEGQYRTYGVLEVSEGVAVRQHSRQWIASLLGDWKEMATSDIQVVTMNGNKALGGQWLGRRPVDSIDEVHHEGRRELP